MAKTQPTLDGLQVLRGVAASLVMLLHVAGNPDAVAYFGAHIFSIGKSGVDIFFVISGFIIAYSTQRDRDPTNFAIKRAARIVPLYWLLTFALFALLQVMPQVMDEPARWPDLVKSLFFIPYWNEDGSLSPILALGWTLNFEMFFYAIFTMALIFIPSARLLFAAVMVTVFVVLGQLGDYENPLLQFFTRAVAIEFVYGIALFWLYRERHPLLGYIQKLWPLAVLALGAQLFVELEEVGRAVKFGIPAMIIVAACLSLDAARLPFNRALHRLGDASYALYLSHLLVIEAVYLVVLKVVAVSALSLAFIAGASIVGSLIAAFMLYYLYEKPVLELLRRTFVQPRRVPVASTSTS